MPDHVSGVAKFIASADFLPGLGQDPSGTRSSLDVGPWRSSTGMVDLGTLGGLSVAYAVDSKGSVVVGESRHRFGRETRLPLDEVQAE